jgi:hypothetical protein
MIDRLVPYEVIHCHDGQFSRDVAVLSAELKKGARTIGYHYDAEDPRPISHMAAHEVYIRVGLADPTDMSPDAEMVFYAESVSPIG